MEKKDFTRATLRRIEKAIYLISAVMITLAAFVVFGQAVYEFYHYLISGSVSGAIIGLLENILLALMLVELLHTLMVSIENRSLLPEPFLMVALVAGIRRILAISVEGAKLIETDPEKFCLVLIEIGVLTGMILVLVISIYLLRKRRGSRADTQNGPDEPAR